MLRLIRAQGPVLVVGVSKLVRFVPRKCSRMRLGSGNKRDENMIQRKG